MRTSLFFFFFLCLTALTLTAGATEVPIEPDAWQRADRIGFSRYLGRDAMMLNGGVYAAHGIDIANGTVSMDVAMHGQRGFVGIVFRHQSNADYELVYLRPHKSRLPDALQYTPAINGMTGWQLYTDDYTAAVEFPLNRWVNVTVEFSGREASVYVDNASTPALTVDLKSPNASGSIGVWGGNVAHISNVRYTASDDRAVPPLPAFEPDPDTLDHWQISQVYAGGSRPHDRVPEDAMWQDVALEAPGIVNISRYHAKVSRDTDLVFARTTIQADADEPRAVSIGYSDEVTVFLNGQPIYHGRSAFSHRYPFALGNLGFENDVVYLPLQRGDNELMLAVGEIFGGWGFGVRLLPD